ncbi:NKAP family protein-like [Zingiber officinale]|uniref:NKAP family protein-like n=1 Tax=Zingiber officinale TaxID=94328 RepID=UPI001C4D1A97|nr:NKAP family protein-like [Zingiber officinale]
MNLFQKQLPEVDAEALKFKELIECQKNYGGTLRPGEGDAIAQYVQQGKCIPRRGEVGLSAEEIQKSEDLGFVMSGSRYRRINVIRIRKENQVYSAEDKRALSMINYEDKAKGEHKVMADLERLVHRHIGDSW